MTLYEQICDINNLYSASKKAMKGKKSNTTVAKFWLYEDKYIAQIHKQLISRSYVFGKYTEFTINDNTVMRKISAAPYSKEYLEDLVFCVKDYLDKYRLSLHPHKTTLEESSNGFVFLGHKVYKTHFRLTSKALRRSRRKLKKVGYAYRYDKINAQEAKNKIFASIGFLKMGKNSAMIDELLLQTTLRRSV